MNGWEFLVEYEKFTKDQKGEIIIVMLTSSSNQDDIDRTLLNKNVNGFISKPLTIENLTDLIEKYFEKIN